MCQNAVMVAKRELASSASRKPSSGRSARTGDQGTNR
ncbi:hypothetical protein A2U01_0111409, partial [Trifolium medium]|nr:hypothetical protein [Trifolium medium]